MEQMIIRICIVLLGISDVAMLAVMIKLTDKINLHHKLISEILNILCDVLGKDDEEEEEEDGTD